VRFDQVYRAFPFAACPLKRNVFGSSPSPQILNDPKSLYQGPAGASELVEILGGYSAFGNSIEEMLT